MKVSIVRRFILVIAVSLLISGLLSAVIFDLRLTDEKKQELMRMVDIISSEFDSNKDNNEQAVRFGKNADGIRITIVDKDGNVTGDSEVNYKNMENHLDREEILVAKKSKESVTIRHSKTIGTQLMYAVKKTSDGYYIRLAEKYSGMMTDIVSFSPALIISALAALIIASYLAGKISRNISKPIEAMNESLSGIKDGTTKLNPEDYPYSELKGMSVKINRLAEEISGHIQEISDEKERIEYILDHMNEGLVMVDSRLDIEIVNKSACKYMNSSRKVIGKDLYRLTRDLDFIDLANEALAKGHNINRDMQYDGGVLEVNYNIVENTQSSIGKGLIIVMTDVTAKRNSEQMRREFFSNASHELKTPITSIKGSAELLCSDIPLNSEQKKEMLSRIGIESDRMCTLIGDILMINRLENGDINKEKNKINIEEVIKEAVNELSVLAEQNKVTVKCNTEKQYVYANERDIRELVSNLIVNAIKYNRENGTVKIHLVRSEDEIIFSVYNDGEVIPASQQGRIFERFYRVDSGRSKAVGGTGLGLAIVKHVVDSLDGKITLESSTDKGTKFTVYLPVIK